MKEKIYIYKILKLLFYNRDYKYKNYKAPHSWVKKICDGRWYNIMGTHFLSS